MTEQVIVHAPAGNGAAAESRKVEAGRPEEVPWPFILAAFGCAFLLLVGILTYQCRANRLRQERIAQDREEERLLEMKVAREMEAEVAPDWVIPHRQAAHVGLGKDHYMSAYKKLLEV